MNDILAKQRAERNALVREALSRPKTIAGAVEPATIAEQEPEEKPKPKRRRKASTKKGKSDG